MNRLIENTTGLDTANCVRGKLLSFRKGFIAFSFFLFFFSFTSFEVKAQTCPTNFSIPNQTDCYDNSVEFTASFTPGTNSFNYQWEVSTNNGSTWSPISGQSG